MYCWPAALVCGASVKRVSTNGARALYHTGLAAPRSCGHSQSSRVTREPELGQGSVRAPLPRRVPPVGRDRAGAPGPQHARGASPPASARTTAKERRRAPLLPRASRSMTLTALCATLARYTTPGLPLHGHRAAGRRPSGRLLTRCRSLRCCQGPRAWEQHAAALRRCEEGLRTQRDASRRRAAPLQGARDQLPAVATASLEATRAPRALPTRSEPGVSAA
jgi:hypothetical protein